MEMEHTHIARKRANHANLFSHRKKPPQSEVILLRSCWMKSEIDNNKRNKPEATGCCPLGGGAAGDGAVDGGGGRVGQSGVGYSIVGLPGWFLLQMRPWKHPVPGTRLLLLLLVLLSDSLAAPAAFRRDAELSQLAGPGEDCSLWTSSSTAIPTTHLKLCAGMRHGTSWQTAKPNNIACASQARCDDRYDVLRISNRWINQIALLGKHCTPIRSTGWVATSVWISEGNYWTTVRFMLATIGGGAKARGGSDWRADKEAFEII